jgi:ribosome-associated translation inhibitor RaiA
MKVIVHDNVKTPHQPRIDYLTEQLTEMLGRFDSAVHQVDVTMTVEGHNGAAVSHCHVAAKLGSLGVVAGDWSERSEHHAFQGAVARLMRGIAKRIAKLRTKRRGVESAAQSELALSKL